MLAGASQIIYDPSAQEDQADEGFFCIISMTTTQTAKGLAGN